MSIELVLRGCNKFQRMLSEFIAFHWVQFTIWSTSIGCRFESRSCSSPCRHGSWGDHTHWRSKSYWPGLWEIRSQVVSSWCINSEIALPTIWIDNVVLSPWMRTLICCWLFPTLVKCECLYESLPWTFNCNRKWHVEVNLNLFESMGSLKECTSDNTAAGREASSSFCCMVC